ncbi:sodium-independent anion transporter [Deinococcus kurensis]|uniref:sodium-independent anion transporter n=1 Tax=Deinococcus kurensis TaxID=2662757 RepID=UPI0013915AEE|nr:sodium-independent anion transporter [Deinococcus kurensis]
MSVAFTYSSFRTVHVHDLRADLSGFDYISFLSHLLGEDSNIGHVVLDFSHVSWIDAQMLAPLGAIITMHMRRNFNVRLAHMSPGIREILNKNGFLSSFSEERRLKDKWGTTIPFRKFMSTNEWEFPNYIARLARNRNNLRFDQKSRDGLIFVALELYNNSISHGLSRHGVFICGQHHPNINKLRFCIADLGRGFEKNVSGYLGRTTSEADSIEWAMHKGNSTRLNRPGGMGLYFLSNFINRNGGLIHIISGGGIYSPNSVDIKTFTKRRYPGSYISLEINTNVSTDFVMPEVDDDEQSLF